MSRLGVGIGFGPQKEDSMSIVCGEPDLSPEEEEEMEETLVSPVGNHGDDDDTDDDDDGDDDGDDDDDHLVSPGGGVVVPASTLRSISAPKLDEVAEARRLRASKSIKSSLLAPGPRFSRLASIIRKL